MTIADFANAEPQVIALWPGGAPGSEDWTQKETISAMQSGMKVIRNVTQPTLTAYLPDPAIATGTAVIVCPGGAFHFLAYEHEGIQVAAWLNSRGIAAFMLKYRLITTSDDFEAEVSQRLGNRGEMVEQERIMLPLVRADSQQAVRLVHQRAAEWGIATNRIGIMGFSAGGRGDDGGHAPPRCEQPARLRRADLRRALPRHPRAGRCAAAFPRPCQR